MNIILGSKGLELATARENLEYRNFYKKDHKAKITYERSTFSYCLNTFFFTSQKTGYSEQTETSLKHMEPDCVYSLEKTHPKSSWQDS